MGNWKRLLYRTDLSDEELKTIPARSNENSLAVWNYYSEKFGITEEDVVKDTPYSFDDYMNPKNWENAYYARITDRNILWNLNTAAVHREPYNAGRMFFNTKNTVLRAFMKLVPAEKLFRETASTSEKFNNESIVDLVHYTKGHAILKNTPYPYFREISLGHECHFLHGIIEAICNLHKFRNVNVRHLICSAKIQNIIRKAYGFKGWTCTEDEFFVYINGIKLARKIALLEKEINGQQILQPEADPRNTDFNAVEVLINFVDKGTAIFRKGEILNAPYCLFESIWNPVNLLYRFFPSAGQVREKNISAEDLDQQIQFTNQKLFEVQEALAESERRLNITEVYTRKSLVEKIRKGEDPTRESAAEKNMAVMFSDIRGFTPLSETMSPADLVEFLNSYFNRMNEMIHKNSGEIDKLIGDCIMAGFASSAEAVQAGIDMKKALALYNRDRYGWGQMPVRSGIGITWGTVVVGNIGSSTKMDHTMIGDTVNASSRIESLTKYYRLGLLVSGEVADELDENTACRFIDFSRVKGKKEHLRIFEVFEHEPSPIQEKKRMVQPGFDEAFECYLAGEFTDAEKMYLELAKLIGPHSIRKGMCADPVVEVFAARCRELALKTENGILRKDEWTGVYRFTEK